MVQLPDIRERLRRGPPLLLDGATGTELERRGFSLASPLWSAAVLEERPELLSRIHRDYVAAGAEIITANTFRTHRRNLAAAGIEDRAEELTRQAVRLARAATQESSRPVWIAGSQSPLEDCYSPDRTPREKLLKAGHRLMSDCLADVGVDLILVETQMTIREAEIAASAATETGLPVIVSFVIDRSGKLLSGESLTDAVRRVSRFGLAGIGVNCLPVSAVREALCSLKSASSGTPVGVYANTGWMDAEGNWSDTEATDPQYYARQAQDWIAMGARFVGGCCGTTPEHIRQLHRLINQAAPAF